MAATPCFEEMFSNMITKLKDKDKVVEVSSQFGPDKSLESMFSYMWNLEEAEDCLVPPVTPSKKSADEAERLRAEGNRCYQNKLLDKALKLYNLSIMSAPHPEVTLGDKSDNGKIDYDEKEYRSLSLGYANRSAVLLELEQYESCIEDIDRALKYGYPKLLGSKLAERRAKCLISLGKEEDAKQAIQEALIQLDSLGLEESKSKTSRDALHCLLQVSRLKVDAKKKSLSDGTKNDLLFTYQTPEAPELAQPNAEIPSLSDAVRLEYDDAQGRYLVAERDISPGEVLVVEKAYGHILHLDSSLRTHCSVCLKRCLTPFPCPSCSRVIFCSVSCRSKGLSTCHSRECNILPTLAALDMGKNAVLAYRILIQTTFSKLKELSPVYRLEIQDCPPKLLGFNRDSIPVYKSSDYRTIYHLVSNKDQRSVSDLFKRCAMAVLLTWLLKESDRYFVNSSNETFAPSQEDLSLTGVTLFMHLMNLPCNAHSITELHVDVSNFQKSCSQEIGSGAFGVLSLTNHSCNPAAARFSYGSTVILRAIRFIPKGSEVTDSYGEHYGLKAPTQRKSTLLQQYCFNCSCEPCKNNWPTYPSLSSKYHLRCLVCHKKIDSKGKCIGCKISYKDSLAKSDLMLDGNRTKDTVEKDIKEAIGKYENAYEKIITGDISADNGKALCDVISIIDKFVEQPCRTYFEAQETLKHYFERQGSCVFRKEV